MDNLTTDLKAKTITSIEVAEMMETEHSKILRKLEGDSKQKGIIATLSEAEIGVADYFIVGTYSDAQGKPRKCYEITKLGCDFLANKFTGEKGIIFTAKYVKRFRDMEQIIKKPLTEREMLRIQLNMIDDVEKRVDKLENNMVIDYGQQRVLERLVNITVITALGGKESNAYKEIGKKVFAECNRDIKDHFDVNSRCNIPKVKFYSACTYIKNWLPCTNTKLLIDEHNAQMNIA
jgi:phage regulator Rha-like protein